MPPPALPHSEILADTESGHVLREVVISNPADGDPLQQFTPEAPRVAIVPMAIPPRPLVVVSPSELASPWRVPVPQEVRQRSGPAWLAAGSNIRVPGINVSLRSFVCGVALGALAMWVLGLQPALYGKLREQSLPASATSLQPAEDLERDINLPAENVMAAVVPAEPVPATASSASVPVIVAAREPTVVNPAQQARVPAADRTVTGRPVIDHAVPDLAVTSRAATSRAVTEHTVPARPALAPPPDRAVPDRAVTDRAAVDRAPSSRRATPVLQARFKGSLVVRSVPEGARVFVRGEAVGVTPVVLKDVPIGSGAVRVEADGYQNWSAAIRVVANQQTRITAKLDRAGEPSAAAPRP